MTDEELEALIQSDESDRVEFTVSVDNTDKICQAICSFANDLPDHRKPGVFFIGVNPNKSCAHLPITDKLLLRLANFQSEGKIQPFPSMVVQKRLLVGGEVAVIIVQPSHDTPVRYEGKIYVRIGPSKRLANSEDERRLNEKRRYHDLPFDLRPIYASNLGELNRLYFLEEYLPSAIDPEVLAQNDRTFEQKLASVRFTNLDDPPVPTVLGLLAAGLSPSDYIPGAYIQFVRFEGLELTDPVKAQREVRGVLGEKLRHIDDIFRANISVALDLVSQPTDVKTPDYPLAALQQLVRNAVMHRSYEGTNAPIRVYWFSDRVEMYSPGGAYGQVNSENFGQPGVTDYRNPHIAEVMKNLGYVQRFGAGFPVIREELARNGNPPLEFRVEPTSILAVVRKRQ